jgi:hypothetical protein
MDIGLIIRLHWALMNLTPPDFARLGLVNIFAGIVYQEALAVP